MFDIDCPDHGCRVLLSDRRILAMRRTEAGLEFGWRCWCGHEGTDVLERPGRLTRVG